MWLSRRQVRWLVILLALLPLVPAVMVVQLMIDRAERERDDLVETETGPLRRQVIHLVERSARSDHLAEIVATHPVGDEGTSARGEALFSHLQRIFGPEASLGVYDPEGTRLAQQAPEPSDLAIITEIQGGAFSGWWVVLDGVISVPEGVNERMEIAWRRAGGGMLAVIAIAGIVWFGVHRGLLADELRSDLLTTVSHEMKTPLASMRVLLETLTDDELQVLQTEEKRRDYLDLVLRENTRLTRLAEDFLTFARLERGEMKVRREPCRIGEIVDEVCLELQPAIEQAGATVQSRVDPTHEVHGDRGALAGVIRNLVENALKYGLGPGGTSARISIETRAEGSERIRLRVIDEGPGVPEEFRKLVFRHYFRADSRLAGEGSGVGLGLAISRQLVRKMKGRIGIEPEAPHPGDRGCCFFVLLRSTTPMVDSCRESAASPVSIHPNPEALS